MYHAQISDPPKAKIIIYLALLCQIFGNLFWLLKYWYFLCIQTTTKHRYIRAYIYLTRQPLKWWSLSNSLINKEIICALNACFFTYRCWHLQAELIYLLQIIYCKSLTHENYNAGTCNEHITVIITQVLIDLMECLTCC